MQPGWRHPAVPAVGTVPLILLAKRRKWWCLGSHFLSGPEEPGLVLTLHDVCHWGNAGRECQRSCTGPRAPALSRCLVNTATRRLARRSPFWGGTTGQHRAATA